MDILVDSSVWFEYFKRNEPYFKEVQANLEILSIKIIDPVLGEILQWALNKTELNFMRSHIQFVPKVEITELVEKGGKFSFDHKLLSRGIGLIDACLIYATIETDSLLWTLDKKRQSFLDKKYLYN
jgi:predicted nucleic acid-binding protein